MLLKYGIKINDFEFYGVKLEQLYIKLDKKIIVRAKQIKLPKFKQNAEQKASDKQLLNLSQGVDYLDTFFQEISLESVQIGDDFKIKILFLDDIFFVDSPYLNIDIKFQKEQQNGVDRFIVRNLSLKDFNVSISGEGSANFDKDDYKFDGNFTSHELNGKLSLSHEEIKAALKFDGKASLKEIAKGVNLSEDELKELAFKLSEAYFFEEI